ncbi:TetR/AcrR family transcriptional regulator [Sinosporangium siamense]|nr:TetR/AcrR family transcriptional regulator [Sinosporangium siamense]
MKAHKAPNSARRNEQSRQAILTATRELIAEVGYAKVTIEAIASRAGVGKQTIYRWWPSKGFVVLESFVALIETEEGAVELPDTGDIEADLKLVMRETMEEFATPAFEAPIRALNTEIINDPALAEAYNEKLAAPTDEVMRARLRSARHAGQLSPDADLDLMAEMLYGPLYQRWLLRSGPLTPEFADGLVEAVLRAFGPRA